jgi:acyl carrier protein
MSMQSMEERVRTIMSQVFGVPAESITSASSKESLSKWDSLGHMNLCAAIEEEFGVEFDADQVLGMDTYDNVVHTVTSLTSR